jgi:hypothetical protein
VPCETELVLVKPADILPGPESEKWEHLHWWLSKVQEVWVYPLFLAQAAHTRDPPSCSEKHWIINKQTNKLRNILLLMRSCLYIRQSKSKNAILSVKPSASYKITTDFMSSRQPCWHSVNNMSKYKERWQSWSIAKTVTVLRIIWNQEKAGFSI